MSWRRILLVLVLGGAATLLLALSIPQVRKRLALAPLYAQTWANQYLPTAVIPTPLPVSAAERVALLQQRATPTLAATLPATSTPRQSPLPVTASATPLPSPTSTATPIPVTRVAAEVTLDGFTHAWQTWNNCGPTTISMNLSYYDILVEQAEAATNLKPNQEDKNVSPEELAAYARTQGMQALVRVNGSLDLLRQLLSNGYPVIVETWLDPEDRGGLGHYRLLSGYDAAGNFIAQDSLRGPNLRVNPDELDGFWRVFNRTYILIYPPEAQLQIAAILGQDLDDKQMWATALRQAQNEAARMPDDPYAWFNLGGAYTALGDFPAAAAAFDEARGLGLPYRMLWYQFAIFRAYSETGRYAEVEELTGATLAATGGLEELYYYRGRARAAQGKPAKSDFEDALAYNPLFTPAADALEQTP